MDHHHAGRGPSLPLLQSLAFSGGPHPPSSWLLAAHVPLAFPTRHQPGQPPRLGPQLHTVGLSHSGTPSPCFSEDLHPCIVSANAYALSEGFPPALRTSVCPRVPLFLPEGAQRRCWAWVYMCPRSCPGAVALAAILLMGPISRVFRSLVPPASALPERLLGPEPLEPQCGVHADEDLGAQGGPSSCRCRGCRGLQPCVGRALEAAVKPPRCRMGGYRPGSAT